MSNEQILRDALEVHVNLWDNRTDPYSTKWKVALNTARAALAQTTPAALDVSVPDDAKNAALKLWNQTGEQLQKADDTLRAISSRLGQGGMWDTENLDYDEVLARITEGIDTIVRVESGRVRVPDDARDAARLDFLDQNLRFKMGWSVDAAPAGNLFVRTIILGNKTIREAIDAAIAAAPSPKAPEATK